MSIIHIKSDTLIDIEHPFRVSAGPGSGKTFWLIEHIKNVLHRSTRLGKTKKIACITYTNIATEAVLSRIGTSSDKVEISTIHSFLYKNIVKPYAAFISKDYNLDIEKMDGHEELILSNYSFLKEWKENTNQKRIIDDSKIIEGFKRCKWRFKNSTLVNMPDYPIKVDNYAIKNDSYFEYKKMAWAKGVVHHDDILFFSFNLIQENPFILTVLRAKFPYFFLDEFQDTNPIQAKIIELIGKYETIVGIIGDKSQSIYEFQGADPSKFHSINFPNLQDYIISENRRSTNQIIKLLNYIRSDIIQREFLNIEGELPTILIGNMHSALRKAQELSSRENVYSLSRKNITSNSIKKEFNNIPSNCLINHFLESDSDKDRSRIITSCIKATELALQNNFTDAIKEIEKALCKFKIQKEEKLQYRKNSLFIINILLKNYNFFKDSSIYFFYEFIKEKIFKDITNIKKGRIKDLYDQYIYTQLSICVNINDDHSFHRTIHKSKGLEFNNVLIVLTDENAIKFLTNPDLMNQEEHRIYYVALSRAKKRAFISIPTLQSSSLNILEKLPVKIIIM